MELKVYNIKGKDTGKKVALMMLFSELSLTTMLSIWM
jgi:hypothetical protein